MWTGCEVHVYRLLVFKELKTLINKLWQVVWATGQGNWGAVFSSHNFLYTVILCFFLGRGFESRVDQYIFIRFKPLTRFACRYLALFYCPLELKHVYVFLLQPLLFSVTCLLLTIFPSMHTHTHTVRCACNCI